ncbi:MAG: hypothetical protein DRZ76_03410, partial [Candidatus Nealsonbacteria bacterium]
LFINFTLQNKDEEFAFFSSSKDINRRKTFIKEENYTGYIYDICVEDNENFIDACGLICVANTFMLYPKYLQMDFAPAKTLWWFPSDGGGGLPAGCEDILRKVDVPVAMSKFAKEQAEEIYGLKTRYIPHGVDPLTFFPLSEEERFKIRVKWGLQDKFVVGTVARNQGRKMMDRTIKAFALFAKQCENAVLFLHTDPFDPAAVFDLNLLIRRYNLQNRCIFSGMRYYQGWSYEQMNEIYNLMDVFLLTTSGEGFGVPIIEAMSCQIPCVVTNYTTTRELLRENGICGEAVDLVGCRSWEYDDKRLSNGTITGSWAVERALIDINDCSDKLLKLYKDKNLRMEYGKMGRKKVLKYYDWIVVIRKWDNLLRRLIG